MYYFVSQDKTQITPCDKKRAFIHMYYAIGDIFWKISFSL